MSIANITAKCWILALFIRDDGERFLLGDGAYDFKDSQQHFSANEMVNDVVDVQGNDGVLLAGQVRRAGSQAFDGYIGSGTTSKTDVEDYRRDFIAFFAKNHFYKVVYVLPDGSAVQRQRGFIVDAPEVKELWQQSPEYHVALNFEDTNYYAYDENAEGEEIYGELANIILSGANGGGAVWEEAAFGGMTLWGETDQKTLSGKNLLPIQATSSVHYGISSSYAPATGTLTATGTKSGSSSYANIGTSQTVSIPAGTYTLSANQSSPDFNISLRATYADQTAETIGIGAGNKTRTFTTTKEIVAVYPYLASISNGTVVNLTLNIQLESGSASTTFEPYVGGAPSPSPDYPQPINTVTGLQTVTVGGRSLELNLGKNLFDGDIEQGGFNGNGVNISATNRVRSKNFVSVKPGTTYTIKVGDFSSSIGAMCSVAVSYYADADYSTTRLGNEAWTDAGDSDGFTFITPTGCNFVRFLLAIGATAGAANTITPSDVGDIQLEAGPTSTPYSAYFDPVELCKIGDFQDSIFKSGGNWYVKKAVSKIVLDGSSGTVSRPSANRFNVDGVLSGDHHRMAGAVAYLSTQYEPLGETSDNAEFNTLASDKSYAFNFATGAGNNIRFKDVRYDAVADFLSWLTSNPVMLYYALATPTDTQITNSTLISQLNAIEAAGRPSAVSAVSPNLPVVISVDVSGGLIWDEVGVVWEAGTGGGTNNIFVDSIASVSPIWEVSGPIANPTIEVLTTGTTLTYEGTIAEGQTLAVDSNKMTALLNGTNVLGSISGDWLRLAPGDNRLVFTATQTEVNSSTLRWQKVVG